MLDVLSEHQYCIIEQSLPNATIVALRTLALARDAQGRLQQAGISKAATTLPKLRSDRIAWLDEHDPDPALTAYFALMQHIQQAVNRGLMMGLAAYETHVALYPAGSSGYVTHLDQFRSAANTAQAGARQLSVVLYLNDDWPSDAGGQLRLYLDEHSSAPTATDRHVDIQPLGGRLVLFLSGRFWHQVLPARQTRISLTGWFKTRAI